MDGNGHIAGGQRVYRPTPTRQTLYPCSRPPPVMAKKLCLRPSPTSTVYPWAHPCWPAPPRASASPAPALLRLPGHCLHATRGPTSTSTVGPDTHLRDGPCSPVLICLRRACAHTACPASVASAHGPSRSSSPSRSSPIVPFSSTPRPSPPASVISGPTTSAWTHPSSTSASLYGSVSSTLASSFGCATERAGRGRASQGDWGSRDSGS